MTENTDDSTDTSRSAEPYKTRPSIRPVVISGTIMTLMGVITLGYMSSRPTLFGDPQYTEIGMYIVGALIVIFMIRSSLKIYLLSRLRYIIDDSTIRTQYTLLYKTQIRELPLTKVRGTELNQGRLQTVLGFGDVQFLSGGTNQSLGFLEFESVPRPSRVQEVIRERSTVQETNEP